MAKKTQAEKTAQNDETAKSNDDPMNDDEEPNFSDPEGFVDDITDEGKYLLASFRFRLSQPRPSAWTRCTVFESQAASELFA